jgi:SAM-dependent methyltransferase
LKRSRIDLYRCPGDHSRLTYEGPGDAGDDVRSGFLVSEAGRRYPINDGIPNLIYPDDLSKVEVETKAEYDRVADEIYDRALNWQFEAFYENEGKVRETMLGMLDVRPGMRILEIGCGTGRDSYRLALRLGDGELHMQDLSPRMVEVCRERMVDYEKQYGFGCTLEYSASNGSVLPYADGFFDAVFHFGGFNHFGDLKKAAAELARVVKVGGRVLFGDEAVAPWLKGTEFDGIVSTNNALFKADIPLACLPESARDVQARWVIANCFYVIAFSKGEGPPPLDLDLPHTGVRGGSLRSRYFGVLEGVSQEAKAISREAAAKAGMSIHEWLDVQLRKAAREELDR